MDPITDIKIHKDSSFAMLLEAQQRGYQLYYLEMSDLYLDNGRAFASTKQLKVQRDPQNWFELAEEESKHFDRITFFRINLTPDPIRAEPSRRRHLELLSRFFLSKTRTSNFLRR